MTALRAMPCTRVNILGMQGFLFSNQRFILSLTT